MTLAAHQRMLVLASAAGLALAGCSLQRDLADDPDVGRSARSVASQLSGTTLQGATFDLAAHRGHAVVLDFWASWCGPCHKQQPELDRLAEELLPQGVVFVGVDTRDDDASGRAYIDDYHVPYPSIPDGDGDIASRFDIPAPPMTLLIDGGGRIVKRILGGITAHDLEPQIRALAG